MNDYIQSMQYLISQLEAFNIWTKDSKSIELDQKITILSIELTLIQSDIEELLHLIDVGSFEYPDKMKDYILAKIDSRLSKIPLRDEYTTDSILEYSLKRISSVKRIRRIVLEMNERKSDESMIMETKKKINKFISEHSTYADENTITKTFKESAVSGITDKINELKKKTTLLKKLVERNVKEKTTFKMLFKNPDHAQEVKNILKTNGYLDENCMWKGLTSKKTELLSAIHVLDPIINKQECNKITSIARIIYNEFGKSVGTGGYITERSLTIQPSNDSLEEFKRIFANILPKK